MSGTAADDQDNAGSRERSGVTHSCCCCFVTAAVTHSLWDCAWLAITHSWGCGRVNMASSAGSASSCRTASAETPSHADTCARVCRCGGAEGGVRGSCVCRQARRQQCHTHRTRTHLRHRDARRHDVKGAPVWRRVLLLLLLLM